MNRSPEEALAAAAHLLWCRKMRAEGWRAGARFDPAHRTHDALVPFSRLTPVDRRSLLAAVSDAADELAERVDYLRGPERPFSPDELRVGMPVALAEAVSQGRPEQGSVESWDIDPASGEVTRIRVRWPDGEVCSHAPFLELRRVGEA